MPIPSAISKLMRLFQHLPGVGPRQASRFSYALLDQDPKLLEAFSKAILELKVGAGRCSECGRAMVRSENGVCLLCKTAKDHRTIIVLEKDQDIDAIERSGVFHGAYHLLGGLVLVGRQEKAVQERLKALYNRIKKLIDISNKDAKPIEIIIAFSTTPEGDATTLYIERILEPFVKAKKAAITRFGRGLSTGAELEYSDPQTIQHAFESRK